MESGDGCAAATIRSAVEAHRWMSPEATMAAWLVDQWQVWRGRIAVGLIVVGAIVNVAMLGTAALAILYEASSVVGLTRTNLG